MVQDDTIKVRLGQNDEATIPFSHCLIYKSRDSSKTMFVYPDRFRYLLVKVRPQNMQTTLADIEQTWQTLVPGRPFDYGFLDQHFEEIYRSDIIRRRQRCSPHSPASRFLSPASGFSDWPHSPPNKRPKSSASQSFGGLRRRIGVSALARVHEMGGPRLFDHLSNSLLYHRGLARQFRLSH